MKYIQRKEQKYYDLLNGLGDCEEIIETFSKEEDTNNLDYCKKFKNVFEEYQEFIANKKERQSPFWTLSLVSKQNRALSSVKSILTITPNEILIHF